MLREHLIKDIAPNLHDTSKIIWSEDTPRWGFSDQIISPRTLLRENLIKDIAPNLHDWPKIIWSEGTRRWGSSDQVFRWFYCCRLFNFCFQIDRIFRLMPLDNLITFLFMNEKENYQFLYLNNDDRWSEETTLNYRRTLTEFEQLNLKIDLVFRPYFLVMKGPESQVLKEYHRCLSELDQRKKGMIEKKTNMVGWLFPFFGLFLFLTGLCYRKTDRNKRKIQQAQEMLKLLKASH